MQQHLLGGGDFVPPRGDGTLVFLRGETVWETAHATAGLLRAWQREEGGRAVIIRNGDGLPLDLALERAGMPTQGICSCSRLRPLLQVMPLALELAFEPKDPYRVLELIALPEGPFRGIVARLLADALAAMPGLGSETWQAAKTQAAELIRKGTLSDERRAGKRLAEADAEATVAIEKAMLRVAEWIEAPGHPQAGAPRNALLIVVQRVQKWLQGRIIGAQKEAQNETETDDHDDSLLGIAYGQAAALAETLTADPRPTLSLVQVQQLVEAVVGSGGAIHLREEKAGRIDHVDCAAALLRSRGTVLWWNCTADAAEAPRPVPFSRAERAALAAVGVQLGDARAQMTETAAAWRRAVLAATDRVVLVAPLVKYGEAVAVHPFWDEIAARMGGHRRDLARVSLSVHDVLHGKSRLLGASVDTEEREETALPASRPEWRMAPKYLARGDRASASSLETLIGCPLRWTLHYRAGLRSGSLVSLPEDRNLYGTLGHRLVELLHQNGAFRLKSDALRGQTLAILDEILPKEGATLLLPGRRGELAQVRHQLATAVLRLADLLHRSKLEIVEVEKEERINWQGRTLEGRLDVLLSNRDKEDVVLDLKWGRTTYADKLKDSTAVQLAVYAFLRKKAAGAKAFPAVAYFSLSRGVSLATDDKTFEGTYVVAGDDAETTWKRTEVTLRLIERHLDEGLVLVAGVSGALPVVQACGGDLDATKQLILAPDAACQYCEFDPVCGLRWEAQR
jgi:RecB family exonuclease